MPTLSTRVIFIFNAFTGIRIDYETANPKPPDQGVIDMYEVLAEETTKQMAKWLDPSRPMHDGFPIPVREVGGKR